METTLIFATHNQHKVEEMKVLIPPFIKVLSLNEIGFNQEIPEPFLTLEENASVKSKTIFEGIQNNCFSEDSGLFIESLHGEPGVLSARYALGDDRFKSNIEKVLYLMQSSENRSAYFKTVISLIWEKKEYFFSGICHGKIAISPQGNAGFGYDPIFIPDGSNLTFAEMNLENKNVFSHRKKAVDNFLYFLKPII